MIDRSIDRLVDRSRLNTVKGFKLSNEKARERKGHSWAGQRGKVFDYKVLFNKRVECQLTDQGSERKQHCFTCLSKGMVWEKDLHVWETAQTLA